MKMSNFGELIKSEFPKIDDDLYGYVEGNVIRLFQT